MLSDIITDVVGRQPDMEVVGRLADRAGVRAATGNLQADVVVLRLADAELPEEYARLFDAHPHVRVLGVAGDGRRAFLWELRPQRAPLGEISPEGLVSAIRAAVQPRATLP